MHNSEQTLEELEALEHKLFDDGEEFGYPNYNAKIKLYRKMHQHLRKLVYRKNEEYRAYLENVEHNLIYQLIHYGTYLKTEYQKDDHFAADCLKEALKYDQSNPIAAYRLGFLAYKHRNYSEAIYYFENALMFQQFNKEHPYKLNSQQQLNAHLYLTNSALYIAKETAEKINQLSKLKKLEYSEQELAPLYRKLFFNDQYLRDFEFYNVTKNGRANCSREACEKLIENQPPQTFILYFSDRLISVFFEDKTADLSIDQGEMLKHFILNSTEQQPTTRAAFSINNTMKPNTYTKNVGRLRNKLIERGFPPLIHTKRHQNETAYYFDENYSYHVLYRVDEEIE